MAISLYYVDYGAGNDTTGNGTIGTPWKTIQKALDTITRNATDGDQICVKAGTAQVLAASLTLATYGAPAAAGPLILRGYTSAANDGGVGEIDCGGVTMWAATSYDYITMADLDIHTFGNNTACHLSDHITWMRCRVHRGASSPSGKNAFRSDSGYSNVLGCHVYDMGTNGSGVYFGQLACRAEGNYIVTSGSGGGIYAGNAIGTHIADNIILRNSTTGNGITCSGWGTVERNVVVNTAAGTGAGINLTDANYAINNILVGFSGAGGKGINANNTHVLGYNAFYNCTSNYTISDQTFLDLTANDVALAADPFTDVANGDFSLTTAAQAALRSLGWPASYLGAHANTDPHITIGALQYGPTPAAADYPAEADVESGVTYGSGTYTGTFVVPAEADVKAATTYGDSAEFEGTYNPMAAAVFPAEANTLEAEAAYGPTGAEYAGTYHAPEAAEVIDSATFGAASAETGTVHLPDAAEVIDTAVFGVSSAVSGTVHLPDVGEVIDTAVFGAASAIAGTFAVPAEADVEAGVQYGAGGTEFTGTLVVSGSSFTVQDILDAMNADPPAVNVTLWAGVAVGDAPATVADVPAAAPSAATVADAVWNEVISGHLTSGTTGARLNTAASASGSGSTAYSNTVTDSASAPLDGVEVWITSDSGGAATVASTTTDTLGAFTVWLDPGTYYLWLAKGGYNFGNPTTITVS